MINKSLKTLCLILMTQFIGCGGRPISMAHFMTDENGGYVTYQKAIGNIKDEEILNSNGEYENSYEIDWNMSTGGIFNIANSPLKLGVEFGLNGLTTQFGYKDEQFGVMGWGTATYGFPCYGVQGAYSLVKNKYVNFGPVIYYARNSTINTIGEYGSFPSIEGGTGYSESGAGFYTVFNVTSYLKLEFDYKYGANWDEDYNKHYITLALQLP